MLMIRSNIDEREAEALAHYRASQQQASLACSCAD
jgi:hypothetical protein